MSLWRIAWRSIQQRSLASALTAVSMALGVTLVVAVIVAHGVIDRSFQTGASLGYNMIVGKPGGDLQMVLNTVYYLSRPVENIPYSYYQEFLPAAKRKDQQKGRFADYVERAVPVCLGDSYEGFRVVATTSEMFAFEYGRQKKYDFSQGRNFKDSEFFEAVIGSQTARRTGLKIGSKIQVTHGIIDPQKVNEDDIGRLLDTEVRDAKEKKLASVATPELEKSFRREKREEIRKRLSQGHTHEEQFEIVGILAPTGTPNDRALFINMEGFFLMDGHAKPVETSAPTVNIFEPPPDLAPPSADSGESQGTSDSAKLPTDAGEKKGHPNRLEPLPDEQREVTAILLRTAGIGGDRASAAIYLSRTINKGTDARSVAPILEIHNLFSTIVGPIQTILLVLAVMIVAVSGIGILVSIYNSMSDRRREIAIMRALGAGRNTVMLIVLLESILLSVGGGLIGWILGHGLIGVFGPWIEAETGVLIGFLQFVPMYELVLIPGLVVLASLVGFLPALSAYRTDVAKSLTATP